MGFANKDKLLSDIADGLVRLEREDSRSRFGTSLGNVEVTFHEGDCSWDFSLVGAINALAENLTWDERGDWSNADRATVATL